MTKHAKKGRFMRKARTRAKIFGTALYPRVSVFRSNKGLYVQLIDDQKRTTILGMGDKSMEKSQINKIKRAQDLGKLLAETAKKQKITQVVFDRSGYKYHGRVKALAEGMREGGLKF